MTPKMTKWNHKWPRAVPKNVWQQSIPAYLYSIFHIIQATGNENIALEVFTKDRINNEPFKNIKDKNIAIKLLEDLKRGNKINPKLTPNLHYGFSKSHFTNESILSSIF